MAIVLIGTGFPFTSSVHAQTTWSWTGGAVNGNWSNPANWAGGAVPASNKSTLLEFNGNTSEFLSTYGLAPNPFLQHAMVFGIGLPGDFTIQNPTTLMLGDGEWSGTFNNRVTFQNSPFKVTVDPPVQIPSNNSIQLSGTGAGDFEIRKNLRTSRVAGRRNGHGEFWRPDSYPANAWPI